MHEVLKCGHCKETGWISDQCGKPEHYYCIYCKLKDDSDDMDAEFGEIVDERDRLRAEVKRLREYNDILRAGGWQLNAENAKFREALEKISKAEGDGACYFRDVADKALS